MDDYAMNQDRDYRERLLHEVRNAPYFLCLLTEDAVEELCALNDSSDNEENIYFQEMMTWQERWSGYFPKTGWQEKSVWSDRMQIWRRARELLREHNI